MMPLASSQAVVISPASCILLGQVGAGVRVGYGVLWDSSFISAAGRTLGLCQSLLSHFSLASLGHFRNEIYSTSPQLQEVIEYPNAGPSIVR